MTTGDKPAESDLSDSDFFVLLAQELKDLWRDVRFAISSSGATFRNALRRLRRAELDYVVIPVGGSLPERSGPRRSFIQRQLPLPPRPMSMESLNWRLAAIADAENVKGVLFVFQGFVASAARLQNFRDAVIRLQAAGKETIVFTPYLDLAHYFAATAADVIVAPPGAHFDALGLHAEALFLKDALSRLGINAEVVQISPYKTAYNMFGNSDITPEEDEQINWLLDESFDFLTAAMAEGRGKSQEEIRQLIDEAPMSSEDALAKGLVDHLAYEDALPFLLAREGDEDTNAEDVAEHEEDDDRARPPKASLATWGAARGLLLEKARRPLKKYIGVVSLEGAIAMGRSQRPPLPIPFLGGATAGEATIVQQLRVAERDNRMAALIFHVDSVGGSPLASDLIWRQIERIAQKKPVLAYMGSVAASGGYYVCAGARHIMAQPNTITGSIGVVTAHISTGKLYENLSVNRVSFSRGRRAGLYSDASPLSDEESQVLWNNIVDVYDQFKRVVASGRDLHFDELDPICGGRVWSGRQARERRLVDSFGDFVEATKKAAEIAGLEVKDGDYLPVVNIYPSDRHYLLPNPYEQAKEVARLFSTDALRQFLGKPMLLLPFELKLW
jgi:protease-4